MSYSREQIIQFFGVARQEAQKSGCLRMQVGAAIVDKNGNILSVGHNAPPPGLPTSQEIGFCNKELHGFGSGEGYHICRSIHAEQRAILELGIHHTKNHSLFLYGHKVICHQCRLFILLAQIQEVYLQYSIQTPYEVYDPKIWKSTESFSTIPREPL